MKVRAISCVLLLAACSPTGKAQREQLLDEIERTIRLPEGASPLSSYARFYTRADDGKILGVFMVPRDGMLSDPSFPKPGERRWVDDGALPVQLDGGCTFVRFEYEPKSKAFDGPDCNGTV